MFAPKDFDFTNPESEVHSSSIIHGNNRSKRKNDTPSSDASDQANKKRKGLENEETILTLENQISIKEGQIKELQEIIKVKDRAIFDLEGKEKAFQAGVDNLDGQIKDLQKTIKDKDRAIRDLEGKEKTLETGVNNLDSQIKDLQETIKENDRTIRDFENKEKAKDKALEAKVSILKKLNLATRVTMVSARLNRLAEHLSQEEEMFIFGFHTCVKAENVDENQLLEGHFEVYLEIHFRPENETAWSPQGHHDGRSERGLIG